MFIYQKINFPIWIGFFLILIFGYCKQENSRQDDSYETYIRKSTYKMCKKLLECNMPTIRTFPPELQKEVSIKNCESSALIDLEEKLNLHTDSMKSLSKGCYEKILNSECKDFLAFAFADTSCYMLKKESDAVYAKAIQMKRIK